MSGLILDSFFGKHLDFKIKEITRMISKCNRFILFHESFHTKVSTIQLTFKTDKYPLKHFEIC